MAHDRISTKRRRADFFLALDRLKFSCIGGNRCVKSHIGAFNFADVKSDSGLKRRFYSNSAFIWAKPLVQGSIYGAPIVS